MPESEMFPNLSIQEISLETQNGRMWESPDTRLLRLREALLLQASDEQALEAKSSMNERNTKLFP